MTDIHPTQPQGSKMKKAIQMLSDLCQQYPEKRKGELLRIVEMKLDLSPRECEFINSQFNRNSQTDT